MKPTVILPGYLAAAREYRDLERRLQTLTQAPVRTVPLRRQDWLITLGGRPVTPILQQLDQTVRQIIQETGAAQINLIGHSAGGWIARIYLGDQPYCGDRWQGRSCVSTLVTLGTPHRSQERWTQDNLDFVNQNYPGAFYPQINYVCVAGKSILGRRSWRLGDWFTYNSYQITCGEGRCWGDGVTPIQAAHLTGGHNLTLEGVLHSPPTAAQPQKRWYGSQAPLEEWGQYLD
ncbi:esterase/lipase family protein [Lyngbya confervoides]|uniref:Lipase n=1 Tax=Lyngbya confervoides BDU141951 TaxID=1574623 RepID=A0ABD4T5L5_9CYAN|nr:lipase [Lyngbya confervoides]MCM1983840.1 lipase [Lyngbya confervoides BDU141951]